MASFNGNIPMPVDQFNLLVEYSITQSKIGNYSDITAIGYIKRNNTNAWPYNYRSSVNLSIDGKNVVYTGAYDLQTDGYKKILSNTTRVYHDNDGKKTITILFSFDGLLWEYYPIGTISKEIELPTIPRVSDINVEKSSFNIGETITITTTKKAEEFTDKIKVVFGKYEKYLTEDAEKTTIWNTAEDATELYKIIPNSTSGICEIIVETYSGEELIGTNPISISLNVANSNPIFNNFTYEDVNPKTLGLTGNNQTIIKGYSNVKGIVSVADKAVAKNESTMKMYRFVIGEKQETFEYSETEEVSKPIERVNSNIFIMHAIDSRGLSTEKQKTPEEYLIYEKPKILNFMLERTLNGVGEVVNINLNGEFWNNNFGQEQNTLLIKYKYKNTESNEWIDGTNSIVAEIDKNNFSYNGSIAGDLENTGFNLENSYDIQIVLSDKLDEVTSQDVVGSGAPNIAMHKNGTSFGSIYDEQVGGIIQANKQQIAVKEEEFLKVFANYSLDDGDRLLTRKGEIYSTEEVRTNKIFIGEDGTKKSIYRKMKIFTVLTQSNTHQEFDLGVEITNTIFSMEISVLGTGALFNFSWFDKSSIDMYSFKGSTNWMLSFKPNSADFENATFYAIMEYIKPQEFYDITNTEVYNLEAIIKDGDFNEPTEDLTEEQIDNELNTIIGGEYGNS